MKQWLLCPYAFWQIDSGRLDASQATDDFGRRLFAEGIEFHARVESAATPLPVGMDLPTLFSQDKTVYRLPLLENRALKICGIPDGVITGRGALIPIEFKSHKDVQLSDKLELAFYSMLLEPYRTQPVEQPWGRLILLRDEREIPVDVELAPKHFAEVSRIIGRIREARRNGVRPRICGCPVCSGPLREEVRRLTRDGKDLTMIRQIGGKRAEGLEALGIADYDELIGCDPDVIAAGMRELGLVVPAWLVQHWRRHAQSYRSARPAVVGDQPPIGDSFIALDLEYDPSLIWLVGLLVVEGDRRERLALWADDPDQERLNLLRIAQVCAEKGSLPVLTWSGTGADMDMIGKAALRLGLGDAMTPALARHVDLYQWANKSLVLPVPTLKLKDVGAYFGIPRTSDIDGGRDAQHLYGGYRTCPDQPRGAELKADLIAYNLEDLEALIGTLHGIKALAASTPEKLDALAI